MKHRLWAWLGAALMSAAAVAQEPGPIAWPPLRMADGTVVAPDAWQGRPTIVVFWATWCSFCKRHNAHIDKLHAALGGHGPRIVGVEIDGDASAARRAALRNGWTFPIAVDDGRLRPAFTARRTVPMTCLVDARSRLRQCIPGEMTEDDVLGLPRAFSREP